MEKMLILSLVALLSLGASTECYAGERRIAFVHVRIEQGELVLDGVKVIEGDMKFPRKLDLVEGNLYFEVLDVSGKRLFEGTAPDPFSRRLEYADEDGTLHSAIVEVEDPFISIRIPFDEAAETVKFYRVEVAGSGRAGLTRAQEALGSVTIELREAVHED